MAKNENEYKRKTQPGKETLNHERKRKKNGKIHEKTYRKRNTKTWNRKKNPGEQK